MAITNIVKLSELEGSKRIDGEYYNPEYYSLLAKLKQAGAIPVKIIAFPTKRKFQPKEAEFFDYIEIAEVDLTTGEFNTSKIIGEEAPDRAQWIVKKNDVLVSTVRPIRNAVTFIREEKENQVCSSGFCVLHSEEIPPLYIFLYLKSDFIAFLLNRYTTATEYPAINRNDVLNIPIYTGNRSFRDAISTLIQKAFYSLEESKSFYYEAENLLLQELGLKDFKPKHELSYTANLSKAFEMHRLDAEYFQPKYLKLEGHIIQSEYRVFPLKKIIEGIRNGLDFREFENEGNPYIRVSDIKNGEIDIDNAERISISFDKISKDIKLKIGDILFTRKGSFGNAAVVRKGQEHAIISSEIMLLRVIDKNIDPNYLAIYLNTNLGLYQVKRRVHGVAFYSISQKDLNSIKIIAAPKEIQMRISSLAQKSHEARRKAKELLEEAKRKVEDAIDNEIKK